MRVNVNNVFQFGNDFNNWVKFFTRTFQAAHLIMDMRPVGLI